MSDNILSTNIFDNCGILFFILVFLLLFFSGSRRRNVTNEVVE